MIVFQWVNRQLGQGKKTRREEIKVPNFWLSLWNLSQNCCHSIQRWKNSKILEHGHRNSCQIITNIYWAFLLYQVLMDHFTVLMKPTQKHLSVEGITSCNLVTWIKTWKDCHCLKIARPNSHSNEVIHIGFLSYAGETFFLRVYFSITG
jgi:hypothetical protein